ncbi:M28 family peptidase [Sphingosinicella humi]|nr:M28 family peptidase [Sphingosinicella humi]
MVSRVLLRAAPLLGLIPAILHAETPTVGVEQMRRHIEVLASDAYEGRKPGTEGENKTLLYIAEQFQQVGLEPGAGDHGWYQPVPLTERRPHGHRTLWTAGGTPIAFNTKDVILLGASPKEVLRDAPVWFVGYGLPEQIAGADLKGAVALLLYETPKGGPDYGERAKALAKAGAAAVIGIMDDEIPWSAVTGAYAHGQTRLDTDPRALIGGVMLLGAGERLVEVGGGNVAGAADPAFKPLALDLIASFDVSTEVRSYKSHNVIGRLRGSGDTGESVLYLGHWDHLGICRPESAKDRICNGAVDNASGIAMLIEIARAIAEGARPARDILFMGTTAEEMGLLGAEYFAQNPTVSLDSLVAAINIDTVAIAGLGEPVAIVGRGMTPLDPLVDSSARELGREVDTDDEANALVQRQDGWVLTRAGVPTVMVGGSFSDMKVLGDFLGGPYHQPEDDLKRPLVLEGAAEDTELLIALGRKMADPEQYRPGR